MTDAPGDVFVGNDTYPVTRDGQTFGWDNTGGLTRANRSNAVDARLAGVHSHLATKIRNFSVDLPAPGQYQIRLALGDEGFAQTAQRIQVLDGATVLLDIAPGSTNAAQFYDASNVLRTSVADWVANNAAATLTFTGSIATFRLGDASLSGYWALAHVSITPVAGGTVFSETINLGLGASAGLGGTAGVAGLISLDQGAGLDAAVTSYLIAPMALGIGAGLAASPGGQAIAEALSLSLGAGLSPLNAVRIGADLALAVDLDIAQQERTAVGATITIAGLFAASASGKLTVNDLIEIGHGAGALFALATTVTPSPGRTIAIGAASRTLTVGAGKRTITITASQRSIKA
ncbi:MAG: hypothetical protein ACOY99_11315 [Pseudomonadota bacterium]